MDRPSASTAGTARSGRARCQLGGIVIRDAGRDDLPAVVATARTFCQAEGRGNPASGSVVGPGS